MDRLVEVKNIYKHYGNKNNITKAIEDISFGVEQGEFVGIMGPSGSGKTTLLNCVATIDEVTSGNIFLDRVNTTELNEKKVAKFRRENLGFVFQDFNLLDILTIRENIILSALINKRKDADKRLVQIAGALGIVDILSKFPYEVSGGQKQRCACARALINQPKLILADEPTGALDSKSARILLETMSQMNEQLKVTIMMVTHDAYSASYAKRILFLKDGQIFSELIRGNKDRKTFFNEIIDMTTLLGGDSDDR